MYVDLRGLSSWHLHIWSMGESIHDALKIMGIVETSSKDADMPQPEWDFYEMFQALIQVI